MAFPQQYFFLNGRKKAENSENTHRGVFSYFYFFIYVANSIEQRRPITCIKPNLHWYYKPYCPNRPKMVANHN